jgi:hypothetical protein
MNPRDLSHIADTDTVAAAVFLAVHYARCIDATARGEDLPDPSDTLAASKAATMGDQVDTVLSVLNLPHCKVGKTALLRFLAGMVDILVVQGGELEMILHAMARPDDERKVVMTLTEDDVNLAGFRGTA